MILQTAIETYKPYNEQEARDQQRMLTYLAEHNNLLTRENEEAHFTASAWIVNPDFTKVAMVFHHIYQSWSWTGGHADGDADLLRVALKEANEELGLEDITPVMTDIFHWKSCQFQNTRKKGKSFTNTFTSTPRICCRQRKSRSSLTQKKTALLHG